MGIIKLLFLADTHLGFDIPLRPRIQRRRRGLDFFANFRQALEPAYAGEVDAVIHGGDLFFRSRVPARLVDMAFAPLKEIAGQGTPVYMVPGNHERSCIPCGLLGIHPGIHIFDRPRTFLLHKQLMTLALAGFPYWRDDVRKHFPDILEATGWRREEKRCTASVLCVHHCFEGATVGPSEYTFRNAEDVIRHRDIPPGFTAVLSGHVHRHQVLTADLNQKPLNTPVLYPGSIERTSFAEMQEKKGCLHVTLHKHPHLLRPELSWEFKELDSRPMVRLRIQSKHMQTPKLFRRQLHHHLHRLDPHSIVRLQIQGPVKDECLPLLRAESLRKLCPREMNISLRFTS